VVGEELGGREADQYWLVDPVDGTVNFLLGFLIVAVSVAPGPGRATCGRRRARSVLGTTFSAARGQGADQDGHPLRVSDRPPERAVVGTGFPFRYKERLPEYLRLMLPALERFEELRRAGAVALDLAWVAAGVFERVLRAGPVVVGRGRRGAAGRGGRRQVTDWAGGDDCLAGDILAGTTLVHERLLELPR